MAKEMDNALFTNQFDNAANFRAHYEGTGPEIWKQSGHKLDGFAVASGTGGTISGCSKYLKEVNPQMKIIAIDCMNSGIFDYVKTGEIHSQEIIHGYETKLIERSGGSTFAEGIGIDRVTKNFEKSIVDGTMQVTDQEAVEMVYYLKENDGILIGPSAAINVVGAVKLAKQLGPGHTVGTIICDGGDRYKSKLFNQEFLQKQGIQVG